MPPDLSVTIGSLTLKNPVICGAGEHVMEGAGVSSAIDAGAGAVVLKSTNESEAARSQLAGTDYVLLDSHWRPLLWDFNPPREAHLLNRSGLAQLPFAEWLDLAVRMDTAARRSDSILVPSLIPAGLEPALEMARAVEEAGLRVLEVNIGAPHGEEAATGTIALERSAERVRHITAAVREQVGLPLWIKLTGQSEDVVGLAAAAREGGADAVTLMGRFMAFIPDVDTQAPLLGTSAAFGGPWALPLTCRWLALSRRALGPDAPLLATNGARDGLDVARFLLAGATAVQMTSASFTGGFEAIARAVAELTEYLEHKGMDAHALIGLAADRLGTYQDQPSRPDHWRAFVPPGGLDRGKEES